MSTTTFTMPVRRFTRTSRLPSLCSMTGKGRRVHQLKGVKHSTNPCQRAVCIYSIISWVPDPRKKSLDPHCREKTQPLIFKD